jgi:hypothetical protein
MKDCHADTEEDEETTEPMTMKSKASVRRVEHDDCDGGVEHLLRSGRRLTEGASH